jgi:hypothetical protein
LAKQPFLIDTSLSYLDWDAIYYDRIEEPEQFKLLADALKASTSITSYKTLVLHQQEQVNGLADVLRVNTRIRKLNLSRVTPSVDARPLIEALKSSNTLEELNLDLIIATTSQASFMQVVSDYLKSNSSVKILTLSRGRIGDEGARLLSEAIKQNTTLQSINLDWCEITDVGCDYLCAALRYHPSMTSITLNTNKIRIAGARALADLLCHNTRLITLEVGCGQGDIEGNYIGDEGCKQIAEALKRNTSLTHLALKRNDITIDGFMELMAGVKNNIGLRVLDVSSNNIGCRDPGQWKYIEECLMYNVTLQSLLLHNTYLSRDEQDLLNRVRSNKITTPDVAAQKDMDLIIDQINGTVRVEQKTMDQILDEMYSKKLE